MDREPNGKSLARRQTSLDELKESEVVLTVCLSAGLATFNVGCAGVFPVNVNTVQLIGSDKIDNVCSELECILRLHAVTDDVACRRIVGEGPTTKGYDLFVASLELDKLVKLLLDVRAGTDLEVLADPTKGKVNDVVPLVRDIRHVHVQAGPLEIPTLKVTQRLKLCRCRVLVHNIHTTVGDAAVGTLLSRPRGFVDGSVDTEVLCGIEVGELGAAVWTRAAWLLWTADGVGNGSRHGRCTPAQADLLIALEDAASGPAPSLALVEIMKLLLTEPVPIGDVEAAFSRLDSVRETRAVAVILGPQVWQLSPATADGSAKLQVVTPRPGVAVITVEIV
ncbi:hypothetical protein HG530_013825 [Fusarium avenaceum]|nr:hypothetical protein HG530_013825 [Fusarium avenaceum]